MSQVEPIAIVLVQKICIYFEKMDKFFVDNHIAVMARLLIHWQLDHAFFYIISFLSDDAVLTEGRGNTSHLWDCPPPPLKTG